MILNLKIFLDILMFSRGPQDLPSSSLLLKMIIFMNIAIGLISVDPNVSFTVNMLFTIIYIAVTLLFIKSCLGIKDRNNGTPDLFVSRHTQVSSSILGIHAIIALFTSMIAISRITDESSTLFIFLIVSLYAWFVNGYIFKNAFDTTMSIGLAISLLHSIACVFVMMIFIQVLAI
ncbi:MAG: hypothetical protein HOI56_01280 [Gammaproteobacteria bacterium]|jgi:hypothetical protein|nr:hypothetical protein [Gammaproteobacteria bacterium]MBT4462904.1 hypothetical protein [Gammaproteobacteria bacterium]MBT4655370.1 hypothetical protein [Gammaproteobacteria bacterium]MBT5116340.1 hypothetical protein [Gammaproteobacteria bacterium]MBT5761359.1 hypothetical protein [Gammaproteobacteria bacterium]